MSEFSDLLKDLFVRLRRSAGRFGQDRIQQKIFYMHVPKCGGSSLVNAMRQNYYGLNPREDRFVGHLDTKAALKAATLLGQDPISYNRDILSFFLAQDYRFVSGHFAFSNSAHEAFCSEYDFVTLLREPVQKWFSLYFFNRYKEGDHYSIDMELEEFLDSETAVGYGCDYAMQFAGDDSIIDFTSQAAIDRAISNLDRFDLVGCLEQLPLFIADFEKLYGPKLNIPKLRQSPVSAEFRRQAITPEVEARVQELNKPNTEIYQYVAANLIGRIDEKQAITNKN